MGIPFHQDSNEVCPTGLRVLHSLRIAKIKSSGIKSRRNAITRAAIWLRRPFATGYLLDR
jgi:hypothetical protein